MNRPVGTVAFLFTDVERSTRAWEAHPAETEAALKRHDEIVAREIEAYNGALILERGNCEHLLAEWRGSCLGTVARGVTCVYWRRAVSHSIHHSTSWQRARGVA